MYDDEQKGFRKKTFCVNHIFPLTPILRNRMTEGNDSCCAFIDMHKAFDWEDQDLLFDRLRKYNITGNIYYCIKALYSHRKDKVNNYVTTWFDITHGVHRGGGDSELFLTLLRLFVNDLLREINDFKLDSKIYRSNCIKNGFCKRFLYRGIHTL